MAKLGMLKNVRLGTGTHDGNAASLLIKDIPVGDIESKANIRSAYSEIQELAQSVRRYGLLQPITVYAKEDGYAVKAGHRRLMAYKQLHQEEPERFHSIRCVISDERNIEIIQLIENVQRVDLPQQDLFAALNKLREQGMTLRQIAEVPDFAAGVNKSAREVWNLVVEVPDLAVEVNKSGVEVNKSAVEVNKSAVEVNKSAREVNKSAREVNKSAREVNKSSVEVNKSGVEVHEPRRRGI